MATGFQNLWNKWTGKATTEAQNQVNAFNAEEAQKARDFEQQMSNTAYQRQLADMEAAGVNPALAMGAAANGASTPSGAQAQAGSDPTGGLDMSSLMSLLMSPLNVVQGIESVKGIKKENELKQKEIDWYDREHSASTEGVILDNAIKSIEKEYKGKFNDQQLKNMAKEYDNLVAEFDKKVAETDQVTAATEAQRILNEYLPDQYKLSNDKIRAEISGMSVHRRYERAQAIYQEWYNRFVDRNDFLPSTNDVLQLGTYIANLFGVSLPAEGTFNPNSDNFWLDSLFEALGVEETNAYKTYKSMVEKPTKAGFTAWRKQHWTGGADSGHYVESK